MQGTARKNPQRLNREEPPAQGDVVAPDWLPKRGHARRAFERLIPILQRMRVLSEGDAEALATGCMALEEYLTTRESSWRRGDSAARRYMAMLVQFGLTPSARTKVHAHAPEKADPLQEWKTG